MRYGLAYKEPREVERLGGWLCYCELVDELGKGECGFGSGVGAVELRLRRLRLRATGAGASGLLLLLPLLRLRASGYLHCELPLCGAA